MFVSQRTAPSSRPGDEDGYALWLRYLPLPGPARAALRRQARALWLPARPTPMVEAAAAEIERALQGLLGRAPERLDARQRTLCDGALVLATPRTLPAIQALGLPFERLGDEGYALRATRIEGCRVTLIAANTERGLLYGSHAWLRALRTGADPATLALEGAPALPLRLLNHWDNLDRTVERGYAGQSIWDWWKLPHILDARYTDYARANASIGINGVVLNNVNARAEVLSAPWLAKVAALAAVLRPQGQRVYLSVRYSSPLELGETASADPREGAVAAWWRAKADEIYRLIPDFGGFLVKANSEGQPGPRDYGCSHAAGANVIAQALSPHGGVLMWRAFVYAAENPADRARQAYDEFQPLDGQFAPNVIVQVKNGPIDFQPREPFHPLFGAMPATPLLAEFQITKEYLGFSTHLAYLGPLYEEVLQSDTQRPRPGTPVAATLRGIAGVANVGSDRNWCGSHFDQANWYAFGRLAWDPQASARSVAEEWVQQTFSAEPAGARRIVQLMMGSREAVVNCMTPLGLHHLMDTGHHHGPGPWVSELARPEWNPTYYHQADRAGIGFDRSPRGSNAVAQYAQELAQRWADPARTPDELLLWFHHLPWDYRLRSGRTLWHELVARYDAGVRSVAAMRRVWQRLAAEIDARRHAEVASHLAQQEREAQWWRDACIAYFQSVNGLPLPAGTAKPALTLAAYRALRFEHAPGRGG